MNTQISQQGFKIGSRILDEDELKVLLPSYDNIFSQIDKFREEAKKISEVALNAQMDFEERFDLKKDYNNIFSILGGRGTGKTSAAATVRHRIINDIKYRDKDIIMPLIVPDDMGEVSDVLGWIITYLGKKIEMLVKEYIDLIKNKQSGKACENKYTQLYEKYCRKSQKLNLDIIYGRVHKAYNFRKEIYQRILAQEYVGKNEYIDETKEVLGADQNLIKDFFMLIEEIIRIKSSLNSSYEPLIYFFFDDVDISAKRGPDVLSTTMRYLTHPNIVTFICGDYKVFSEMLTIDFLQKESLLDSGLMEKIYISQDDKEFEDYALGIESTALNSRKIRGYDYLKKMLPPALRYEMPKLNNESKANFRYTKNNVPKDDDVKIFTNSNETKTNKELTLLQLLEENFHSQEELEKGESFLQYKGQVVYSYFSIFDSTPRGLINPYYFLYQMLQDKEAGMNVWTSSDIKQFMDIIIGSSLVLGDYKELINRVIRIIVKAEDKYAEIKKVEDEYGKIEYYIDYSYLDSVFDEVINRKDEYIQKKVDDFIILFILAHFFENILVVVNHKRGKKREGLHGARLLCKILNSLNVEGNLYPQISNVNRMLYIHYLLNDNMSKINSGKIFSNGEQRFFVWKYYNSVLKVLFSHERENDDSEKDKDFLYNLFENIFIEDREWVKKKIRQLFEFGKTNKKIFLDIKRDFQNKYTNLETKKGELLNSRQLKKFSLDIDNNLTMGINGKNRSVNDNNYSGKLQEILNSIKKKNKIGNKIDENYEELLEKLEELFIVMKQEEKLDQIFSNYEEQLSYYENKINSIEERFDYSINEIIHNRNNIYNRIKSLENFILVNNAQSIIDDMGEDIKDVPFDHNNEIEGYVNMLIDGEDKQKWDYLPLLNVKNIANRYGIKLDIFSSKCGTLLISKNRKISKEKKVLLITYYLQKEELRLIKNYILPEINKDTKVYENIIDKQNELNKNLESIKLDLEEIRESKKNVINSFNTNVTFQEDSFDEVKTNANLCIIKREVTRIFEYNTSKRNENGSNDNNDSLEITRNLINMYKDIIDASYEVIINQLEEFYVVMNDYVINKLKYLQTKYISELMKDRIEELLSYGIYVDKSIIDNFKDNLRYIIMRRSNGRTDEETRHAAMELLEELSNVELRKKQESSVWSGLFATNNAYEHINFILEDYIKLSTLFNIIKVESNSASQKLREEVINLIGSNAVSRTNKFSSFKRFIESLQE